MAPSRNLLVLRPLHDTRGKKDVTYAFAPESEKFLRAVAPNRSTVADIDNRKSFAARRHEVLDIMKLCEQDPHYFDGVAFFCHGWKGGIQLGFRNQDVDELADAIHRLCEHSFPVVPLYCCSTGGDVQTKRSSPGSGDSSFADLLRDALCKRIAEAGYAPYPRVMGHTTVAHTTRNPYARFFDGMGSGAGGTGGYWTVKPKSELWGAWRKALRGTDLRFRFPFMEISEIHEELQG